MAFIPFKFGGSGSSTSQTSFTNRDTFLAPFQEQALASLFGQTSQLTGLGPQAGNAAFNQVYGSGGLLSQGNQLAGGLQNIAAGRFGQGLAQTIGLLQNFQGPGSAAGGVNIPGASAVGGLDLGGPLAGTGALQNIATSSALSDSLLQENPALQGSLDVLGQNIQENLRASLGQVAGQAGLSGARGGARQAMAAGQAAGDASRAFAQGAGELISQDFAARQQLAPQLLAADQRAQLAAAGQLQTGDLTGRGLALEQAGLLDTFGLSGAQLGLEQAGIIDAANALASGQSLEGLTQAGALGLGASDLQVGAGQAGLQGLIDLFGLGQSPFGAAFGPLQLAANIYGAPIILDRLRERSESSTSTSEINFGLG